MPRLTKNPPKEIWLVFILLFLFKEITRQRDDPTRAFPFSHRATLFPWYASLLGMSWRGSQQTLT